MKWVDSVDLRGWANRRDCQDRLPHLVRKLIRATSNTIQSIKFPSGDNVSIGGWDGILEVSEDTEYLPIGISLWEFGAGRDPKGKADEDYEKRTTNPLGFDPAQSTFIFVTPRLWKKGEEWIKEKMKDGIWKEIRVFNAEILEEWIEVAPTVGAWLSKVIGKYPAGGIQPTDDFWEEWTSGPNFELIPELFLGGRKKEQKAVIELSKQPSVIPVQGASRDEALAFILSCFKNIPDREEDFFSRSLIVDDSNTYRELSVHDKSLIFIPRFEDVGIINRAVHNGHIVIVPLGADASNNWQNKITLPRIDRDKFVSALEKAGLSNEFAKKYSRESARNITILRRQLEFERALPEWALPENIPDIIPALLIGRWDEGVENDREILAKIAGDSYENYSKKLNHLLHVQDAPIIKIGSNYRLTSPLDAWTNASRGITRNDFNLLHKSAIEVILETDPAFQLEPERRYMASIYGKDKKYSSWIREGIIQSLILTSIFGDNLSFDLPFKADIWVNKIISELLSSEDPLLWKSFGDMLPLIAEASPTAFLDALEKHLSIEKSPILALFDEDPGFLSSHHYHTGLLWALESLSWFPDYLSRASLILAKLVATAPEVNILNKPENSLMEIFQPWHYQTLALFEERMQVLQLISKREPEVAWELLTRLLPGFNNRVASPTNKMRWRMFEMETEQPVKYKEMYDAHSTIVDLLIQIFDYTETKLANLIDKSQDLALPDREKVLLFVEDVIPKVEQTEYTAWHTVRDILHRHRSSQDAKWAVSENQLERFEKLYEVLRPSDEFEQVIWMFNDHWPNFPEGYQHGKVSVEEQEKKILEGRIEGLKNIYEKYGLDEIIKMSARVKEKWVFGDVLGYIVNQENEIVKFCKEIEGENVNIDCIQNFIFRKSIINGFDWITYLFEKLGSLGPNDSSLAKILVPLNQNQDLWNFVESTGQEIKDEYWKNIRPRFYHSTDDEKIFGLEKLVEYKRFLSALDECRFYFKDMPSQLLIEILEKAGTEHSEEEKILDHYHVNEVFKELDERNDIDEAKLIQLEWIYLPILANYGNIRKPKRLHNELSKNPDFFNDVLKWVYKPSEEKEVEKEEPVLTDEQKFNRYQNAYKLLHSWKKIPGVNPDGEIDSEFLNDWISKSRKMAEENGRLKAADIQIGQVLAHYPEEKDKIWPPDEICSLIEGLNSDVVNRNFSSSTFNKRGSTSRGVFEGGNIERAQAEYFLKLAAEHKNKFPTITTIFERLARSYEEEAKRMDEEAERGKLDY